MHEINDLCVLLGRPGSFDEFGVKHLLPPVEALDFGAVGEGLRNFLPVPVEGGAQSEVRERRERKRER